MTATAVARALPRAERQVDWRDLAGLIADHHLTPGYSQAADRAYVYLDDTLVWADCADVALPSWVPGANAIAGARMLADADSERAADEAWLSTLTEDQRVMELQRRVEADRRLDAVPDPSQEQVDAYCERNGIQGVR